MAKFDGSNEDGRIIVKLDKPVQVNGEEVSRMTIPPLNGRLMRKCKISISGTLTWSELSDFTAEITTPAGAFDALDWAEAKQVSEEVLSALGKAQRTGKPDLPP